MELLSYIPDNLSELLQTLYALINAEVPVIAAVDGVAYGGGFSLALCADILLATPRAKFCLVFGRIGLHLEGTVRSFFPT